MSSAAAGKEAILLPEVWVWLARTHDGRLHAALPEVLYEAGALARRLDARLVAIGDVDPTAEERAALAPWHLADLRVLGHALPLHPPILKGRSPLSGLPGIPRAFLLVADTFGMVVAPLVAAEHDANLVTFATSVTADGTRFVAARSTLGGQYEAIVRLPLTEPLVVTLQPGSVGYSGWHPPEEAPAPAAVIRPPDAASLAVSDADRIVAFGRGAFSRDAIALVERLAGLLGATVAGTRPAADEGWLPFAKQVGLTGAIVTPKLYVAVGISGAPYHMVGVKDPECLIAINRDPEAPIFSSAHLGLVGDLHAVLPALIARLEQGHGLVPAAAALDAGRAAHTRGPPARHP
jgi:electron transfer flavoprotein alpha subunit